MNDKLKSKIYIVNRELPFPPENVRAQRLAEPNQRTVQLSWTASFDGNSPILKYIVQRREVSEIGKLLKKRFFIYTFRV